MVKTTSCKLILNTVDKSVLKKMEHDQKIHKIKQLLADWKRYGRVVGPYRNKWQIMQNVLVAFWDGKSRGTKV